MNELYWIWLQQRLGAGSRAMAAVAALLRESDSTVEDIHSMSAVELKRFGIFAEKSISRLEDKSLERAKQQLARCEELGCRLLCYDDAAYPDRLRNIYDPPAVLYYLGELPEFERFACFGIVGTRNASKHGMACSQELAERLCKAGAIIVSGGARGIDAAAHSGALAVKGKTVAILGCGVDYPYYPSGRALRELIEKNGAVISEYPPGTEPQGYFFPIRNRIISGLSLCVAVIEGTERSGSVVTANLALEQGREVFAVPGYVGLANSRGVNALLRDGARPLTTPNDILQEYAPLYPGRLFTERNEAPLGASNHMELELPDAIEQEDTQLDMQRRARRGQKAAKPPCPPGDELRLQDALERSEQKREPVRLPEGLSENAAAVFEAMGEGGLSAEELAECCGKPVHIIIRALTELEIAGAVTSLPGMRYKKEE